jgi:hypothetical protein
MGDMTEKTFEAQAFGKAALQKLGNVVENFRLFHARWVGDNPGNSNTMEVTGAEFRAAKSGTNKGKLSIMMTGTKKTVFVTKAEMLPFLET